jgi:hypothetical protein
VDVAQGRYQKKLDLERAATQGKAPGAKETKEAKEEES